MGNLLPAFLITVTRWDGYTFSLQETQPQDSRPLPFPKIVVTSFLTHSSLFHCRQIKASFELQGPTS